MPTCTTPAPSNPITEGFTAGISLSFGSKYAGLVNYIYAQLIDEDGDNYYGPILDGFIEIGNGYYYLSTLIPNAFRGSIKFLYCGDVIGLLAINPEEYERIDVNISSRAPINGVSVPSFANPIPINPESPIEFRLTDDYSVQESRSLDITSVDWPDLTGSTTEFIIDSTTCFKKNATLLNSTSLRIELSNEELASIGAGRWNYEFRCTLANTHVITLAVGNLVIVPPFSD